MHRLMTAGLWVLGLVTVVGGAASADGPPLRWWDQAPLAAVQERLAQGADLTVRNDDGQTPLYEAAESNADPAVVALLLDRGADINAPDLKGTTPLEAAARSNANPAVVALLLDRGAAVNNTGVVDDMTYLLTRVAANADPAVVALLLGRGADINAPGVSSFTPLHLAAGGNTRAVVALLLDRGADPILRLHRYNGETPLHYAAGLNKDPAVVALLLDRGADINAPDLRGQTPLHWAVRRSSWRNPLAVVALLLDRGADPTLRDHQNRLPVELVGENSPLQGTDVYGRLQAAR